MNQIGRISSNSEVAIKEMNFKSSVALLSIRTVCVDGRKSITRSKCQSPREHLVVRAISGFVTVIPPSCSVTTTLPFRVVGASGASIPNYMEEHGGGGDCIMRFHPLLYTQSHSLHICNLSSLHYLYSYLIVV